MNEKDIQEIIEANRYHCRFIEYPDCPIRGDCAFDLDKDMNEEWEDRVYFYCPSCGFGIWHHEDGDFGDDASDDTFELPDDHWKNRCDEAR